MIMWTIRPENARMRQWVPTESQRGILMGDYMLLVGALAGVVIVGYAFWAPDLKGWFERMRDNKR
jgi:hypothetical protein